MTGTIGRNDSNLAHGVARHNLDTDSGADFMLNLMRLTYRKDNISVKEIDRLISKEYAPFLVYCVVSRANGSRAKAGWWFLFPSKNKESCGLFALKLYKARVQLIPLPIYVSTHCLARTHQRTTNNSDLAQVVAVLRNHLMAIILKPEKVAMAFASGEMITYAKEGKVIWTADSEDSEMIATTWVSSELYGKEDLEMARQLTKADQIGVCV